MSLTHRSQKSDETPQDEQEYNQNDASAAEDMHMSEQIQPRNPRPNHPMRRATDLAQRANILAAMAGSGSAPEDEVRNDHTLASSLSVEHSAIDAEGRMDNHRKPIISIHGKDIDEHELGKNVA